MPAFGTLLALLALAVAPWRGAVPAPANANGPGVGFAAAAMASPRPASIVAVRSEAETPDADGSRGGGEGVVTGTLLDVDDRPLAGVTIGCFATTDDDRYPRVCVDAAGVRAAPRAHAAVAATTRADGTFRCNVPLGDGRLRVVDDAWVTVMAGVVGLDAPPADVVVAAPARAIAGTVFDADGSPLDGATIECRLPATLRSRIARPLDRCVDETLGASSAPDGAFVIRAADVRGAELVFRHPNCTSLVVPRDAWRSPFVVRLAHADASSARALRVLDADGAPVAGAAVTCRGADALVETDAEGFAPLPRAAVPIAALRIVARGYLPHTVAAGDLRAAAPLAVVLREPAASIAGTVIGPSGAVVAGAWVWIADPEVLRDEPQRLELVESRLAGAATTWKVAVADQQGRFELTGLQDRRYTLRASLPRDVAFAELADVAAGTQSLRVCCSGEPCVATVRGRVVDTAGNVVAGAIVAAQRQALRIDLDGGRSMRWYANGRAVRTGDDGSFLLHDVPDAADLAVSAETVVSATFAPSAWRCGAPTFVVDRPCHLRVLAPAQPGLEFEIRDANGDVLPAQIVLGIASRPSARTPIVDGASAVVVVPSRAREVCLLDASGVVDRRSLRLDRAAVTVVTF